MEPESLFGRHVRRWVAASRAQLVGAAAAWGARGPRTGAEGAAAVAALYAEINGVLSQYERVASRWPVRIQSSSLSLF